MSISTNGQKLHQTLKKLIKFNQNIVVTILYGNLILSLNDGKAIINKSLRIKNPNFDSWSVKGPLSVLQQIHANKDDIITLDLKDNNYLTITNIHTHQVINCFVDHQQQYKLTPLTPTTNKVYLDTKELKQLLNNTSNDMITLELYQNERFIKIFDNVTDIQLGILKDNTS